LQQTVTSEGHVNIWRTVVLRGIIFGTSRTKGDLTVTYSRPMCPKCGKPVIDHPHRSENGDPWHSNCFEKAQEELRKSTKELSSSDNAAQAVLMASKNNDESLFSKTINSNEVITQLERLAKLKEQGILTEEELQAQKKKILGM